MVNVQFIKDALYHLKQNYGYTATLIKVLKDETNSETGQRTVTRDVVPIAKCVDLPSSTYRRFWYDMAFLKANTNFTYGGEVSVTDKEILLDARDLKKREVTTQDYIIIKHKRYEIAKVYDLEHNLGYLLSLKAAEGTTPYDIIALSVQSNLQLYGEAVNTP